jgi:hypothetical protein
MMLEWLKRLYSKNHKLEGLHLAMFNILKRYTDIRLLVIHLVAFFNLSRL